MFRHIAVLTLGLWIAQAAPAQDAADARPAGTLRVVSCDAGSGDVQSLADVLRESDADVICLQGAAFKDAKGDVRGQADLLAERLGLYSAESRGQAILSRHPLADVREMAIAGRPTALVARIAHPAVPGGMWAATPATAADARTALSDLGVPADATVVCGEFCAAARETTVRTLMLHPAIPQLPMLRVSAGL